MAHLPIGSLLSLRVGILGFAWGKNAPALSWDGLLEGKGRGFGRLLPAEMLKSSYAASLSGRYARGITFTAIVRMF